MAIDFKGVHYPKAVVPYAVFFYVRYAVSYRDLEEIMAERGVVVDLLCMRIRERHESKSGEKLSSYGYAPALFTTLSMEQHTGNSVMKPQLCNL